MATKSHRSAKKLSKGSMEDVFCLVSEMEEPLREIALLLRVLALVDSKEGDGAEAISFVATKACHQLKSVSDSLRNLFLICRRN
jgi:hypothetical protein